MSAASGGTGPASAPPPAAPALAATPLLAAAALGVLVVAVAYAAGRAEHGWAPAAYWAGQLLLILSTAMAALPARASRPVRVGSLAALAVAQAALVWCYRPLSFRFIDEFQHLRSARDVLGSHHLFTPNSFLDVSPGFPGLEEVTTALAQAGHASVFAAGSVVVGVAHVLLVLAVFLLLERVSGDGRTAAAGTLMYAAQPHSNFLNALFLYSVLALPFFVLALLALHHRSEGSGVRLALACVAVCVVTHHVTALAVVGLLLLLGAVSTVTGRERRRGLWHIAVGLAGLTGFAVWAAAFSPGVRDYLLRPARGVLGALTGAAGASAANPVAPRPALPLVATAAIIASTLVLIALVSTQALSIWRKRSAVPPWQLVMSIGGLAYFGVLVMRVALPGSPELSARALTYAVVLAALPMGAALVRLMTTRTRGFATGIAMVVVVYLGGLAAGWPAQWERVPSPFRVAAFERGVDSQVSDAAHWAEQVVPTGRIACDRMMCAAVGAVTHTDQENQVAPLYIGTDGDVARLEQLLDLRALDTVYVDRRMLDAAPLTGSFFAGGNSGVNAFQPTSADLLTFSRDRRLDRWYDSGDVQVYRRALGRQAP